MADVYRTVICTAANVDTVRIDYATSVSMTAEATTDAEGTPPATHYFSAGFLQQQVLATMEADPRLIMSDLQWRAALEAAGLTRVVYPEE